MTRMVDTVHTKENGRQVTYRVAPATDATGKETGQHVFRAVDGEHEYVGEGDPAAAGWEPTEGLTDDDAPSSALDEIAAFEEEN